MKNFIFGIGKLAALLVAVFLVLIQIDYLWSPDWLTGERAVLIMCVAFVLYMINTLRKFCNRKKRKAISEKTKRHHKEAVREPAEYKPDVSLEDEAILPRQQSEAHRESIAYSNKKRSTRKRRRRGLGLRPAALFVICSTLLIGGMVINRTRTPSVPEQVADMGRKYPEAKEYVTNFNRYKDIDFDMTVTNEMEERTIPLFIQWDKRWGYRDYGGNYIGVAGCAPSCMAMVICGLNQDPDINPYVIATYGANQGWYTLGEGTSWDMMMRCGENYGITATRGELSSNYIKEHLSTETPMICSMTPGDFTYSGHFIVLTAIDEDGLVTVNDPNSPKNSSKKWELQTLLSQMKAVWVYQK